MRIRSNLILRSDSYKYSHPFLYADGVEETFFHIISRGGLYNETLVFGLQYYLKEYLSTPITMEDIDEAEEIMKLHGEPFYREGWEHILKNHNGYLPLRIRAVKEGSIVPVNNVLITIQNTDPVKCFWLPGFIETLLLKVWYPITVASRSKYLHDIILAGLEKSSDDPKAEIDFKLHSFGYRGCSSEETAGIGGMAETIMFKGSDTVAGIVFSKRYYNCPMSAFSIPALEHSVVCSYDRDKEVECYRKMLNVLGKPGALLACVSDTYDLWNCIENVWGKELKQQVIDSGACVVVRPDSGVPHKVVLKSLMMLDAAFGHTVNSKGYKVLNYVRLIQGDGINDESLKLIIDTILEAGYSLTNVAFGMGGGMLQQLDRDTMKFAMKLSAVKINGKWKFVSKDPITDPGKKSKAGLLDLTFRNGKYKTHSTFQDDSVMYIVWENGKTLIETSLDEIRKIAGK